VVEEVLMEGPSKRDPKMTSGRTAHNKLVHVPAQLVPGTFADVRITRAAPHFLAGELVEVTAAPKEGRGANEPKKRVRIPVVAI
jgi:tRNA-2-methylthio-N6-dimethylallyladenosine synthase